MDIDSRGRTRIVRTVYEACVRQALRDRLRCKEIWVVGAHEWRNPDEDLPADFEASRAEHYEMLHKPLDAGAFVAELREELRGEMAALNEGGYQAWTGWTSPNARAGPSGSARSRRSPSRPTCAA